MELFKKFRETIFLKEDSNLEKQIQELKTIRDNVVNKEQIDRDIKILEYGLQGEKEIAFELKNANLGMYVLHDITIEFEELKAQIDYIIITKGYIYLVECKNLIGNITVDNKGEFKREYEIKDKKIKEGIYSPYTQAVRHKEVLKKRWLNKNNAITTAIQEKYFDTLWYKPLVVLSNSKSLLNINYAPQEIKKNTIRVDQLISYIKKDIETYDKDLLKNQKEMLKLANSLLKININEYVSNKDKYISKENNTGIEQKLKQFRKEKSTKMNVPAYYIFTDNEMNKIIENMPKNIQELKNIDVLPDIKLKLHGEEIIKIINNK